MNKELIKKYKAEFDHWLNGGNVLRHELVTGSLILAHDTTWKTVPQSMFGWGCNYNTFIINDKYAEFRKALADGKTVEFRQTEEDLWTTANGLFHLPVQCYRIKPDEPKFKVGDWVRVINSSIIFPILEENVSRYKNINSNWDFNDGYDTYPKQKLEPWQPKLGEWCWFYAHIEGEHLSLGKFLRRNGESYVYYDIALDEEVITFYCEPFIGTLPSIIKN